MEKSKSSVSEKNNKSVKKSDDSSKTEKKVIEKEPEGWESDWDDFDVDDNQEKPVTKENKSKTDIINTSANTHDNPEENWGDFGDWGNEDQNSKIRKDSPEKVSILLLIFIFIILNLSHTKFINTYILI